MESDEPRLKGSLLKIVGTEPPPSTQLRGDLFDRFRAGTTDSTPNEKLSQPHEVVVGARIVQRDSGVTFEIVGIDDITKVVQLKAEDGHTVTLAHSDLLRKLETEGSPWHW